MHYAGRQINVGAWYRCWQNILEMDENTYYAFLSPLQFVRICVLFERLLLSPERFKQRQFSFPTLDIKIYELEDSQKEKFCKNVGYGEGCETHKQPKKQFKVQNTCVL